MRAVNLIPPERRTGASVGLGRSGGGAYGVLALVGVLALLIVLYGKANHQVKSNKAQAQKITAEAASAQNEAGNLARYNGLIAQSEARTQAVEQLVDTRFDWAHAFHELGRVLPKQVSIASLTGTIGSEKEASKTTSGSTSGSKSSSSASSSSSGGSAGASSEVTSATPPGSVPTFVLTGCAGSQTVVAQLLERLRLIEGVKEATLQSSVSSAGSGGSGGAGACPGSDPTFAVSIVFEPLPAAAPKTTTTVSDTAGSSK